MQTPGQDETPAARPPEPDCDAGAQRPPRPAPVFDNREAMAYIVFRAFNCSRARAVEVVDEMLDLVPSIRKAAGRRWRRPPRR